MNAYVQLIRPPQWIKNLFVFAALAFGNAFGKKVGDRYAVALSLLAFAAFCLASSAGYVFNDILDRHRDRLHPMKKDRPIASGQVSIRAGAVVTLILLAATLA
ncbi:MAG: UbiA family prenyltransferase, partial [Planctomycetes bacterium]|nr:UbiA family prenyltransferase [Planctomycetota bacterium]